MEESQPTPLSVEQCKELLVIVAKMMCVKAELISNRLLSIDDKKDMLNGNLSIETLVTAVKVWIENKMPDYANGNTEPYRHLNDKPMRMYGYKGKSS
jgi:hypothetical protein